MVIPEQVARQLLRRTMRRYDLGWDIPDEALPLPEFLSETTIYFTELFLNEAVINLTNPYEDEVIAGGLLSHVVASGMGRVFQIDFEIIAKEAFYDIYCFAFLSDPEAQDYYWRLTRGLFLRISQNTFVLDRLSRAVADFYETPSDQTLQGVARAIAALRAALIET